MKINWGTAIVIAYILFAGMLVVYMVLAAKNPSDLVAEDYYEQEIKYQDRIKNTANGKAFGDLQLEKTATEFRIVFPEGLASAAPSGKVHFYRPNKADLDQKIELLIKDNRSQSFKKEAFVKGFWQLKVEATDGQTNYYWELNLTL